MNPSRAHSAALFARASNILVGGVSSPVRAFRGVTTGPICLKRGEGQYVFDVDGNRYLDFVSSYGPLILGHANERVLGAIAHAAKSGTSFGATVELEVELAEQVASMVPSVEKLRFVSSGTEATMSALRVARGATGRTLCVKFAGCYHGHADPFLVDETGSGLATFGLPGSAGVTRGATADTITLPYNDLAALEAVAAERGDELAAIIVEPVACNMGLVLPKDGFLAGLRHIASVSGAVLIFDEVITGFRLAPGGAQSLFGVTPDLTTFGKILGGGLPVGAYGGRNDIMCELAPLGPVYQAGTLSGNPVAMAAGLTTLRALADGKVHRKLAESTTAMAKRIDAALAQCGQPAYLSHIGSIFHLWCKPRATRPPNDYADIKQADTGFYARLFAALLDRGVALAPSAFEVGFLSAAHTDQDINVAVAAMASAFATSIEPS